MAEAEVTEAIEEIEEEENTPKLAEEPKEPSDLEKLAIEEGWSPKDKWRGDPEKWTDAASFIRNGRQILKTTLSKQDAKLEEVSQTIKEFAVHHQKNKEAEYKRALADLKAQQKQAVRDGDEDAFEAIDGKIEELNKEVKTASEKPKDSPDEDPNFKAWWPKNDWYGPDGDPEMTVYAETTLAPVLNRKYQGAEFYEKLTEAIKKKFPEHFENPNRKKAPAVEGGGSMGGGKSNGQSYSDLPPEAKQACDRYIKQGLYVGEDGKPLSTEKARAKYTREYFLEESM